MSMKWSERGAVLFAPGAFLPGAVGELQIEIDGNNTRGNLPRRSINGRWNSSICRAAFWTVRRLDYDTDDAVKQQRALDAIHRSTRSGQPESV